MLLALNGVLPVALIISGLMLISARFSASPALRAALIATWVASAVLLIVVVIGRGAGGGREAAMADDLRAFIFQIEEATGQPSSEERSDFAAVRAGSVWLHRNAVCGC